MVGLTAMIGLCQVGHISLTKGMVLPGFSIQSHISRSDSKGPAQQRVLRNSVVAVICFFYVFAEENMLGELIDP